MTTRDFEKAIEALGVQGLEITKFSYHLTGVVGGVYARIGEKTFLWWDAGGRGFRFELNTEMEGLVVKKPEFLDYTRDKDFDLTF
jgi:hypothetical protein